MNKLLIVFGLIFIINPYFANEKIFRKLDRVYQKNPDKCLELAKLYTKKFPKESEPYYFLTVINKDKYVATSSLSAQYGLMGQLLFYASCFDTRGKLSVKEQVSWNSTRQVVESEAQKLIKELIVNHYVEKSKKIAKKLHNLNSSYPEVPVELNPGNTAPKMVDVPSSNVDKDMELANLDNFNAHSNGKKLYFGAPSGTEIIEPTNVSSEKELLKIINTARLSKGMKPLIWDENLSKAARYHAYDMASQAYFDHDSHDRVNNQLQKVADTFERIKKFYSASFVNSENIAAGSSTPEGTYNQWFNSPGHNKNMFNNSSKKVGIGLVHIPNSTYGYYWVFCTAE